MVWLATILGHSLIRFWFVQHMIFHVSIFFCIWVLIKSVAQLFQGDGSGQASGDSRGKSGEGRPGGGTCQVGDSHSPTPTLTGSWWIFTIWPWYLPLFLSWSWSRMLEEKISEQLRITLFFCQLLNSGYCFNFCLYRPENRRRKNKLLKGLVVFVETPSKSKALWF